MSKKLEPISLKKGTKNICDNGKNNLYFNNGFTDGGFVKCLEVTINDKKQLLPVVAGWSRNKVNIEGNKITFIGAGPRLNFLQPLLTEECYQALTNTNEFVLKKDRNTNLSDSNRFAACKNDILDFPIQNSKITFTVDVKNTEAGCDLAMYFTNSHGMRTQDKKGPCGDYYCDANSQHSICSSCLDRAYDPAKKDNIGLNSKAEYPSYDFCSEMDFFEGNKYGIHVTPHACLEEYENFKLPELSDEKFKSVVDSFNIWGETCTNASKAKEFGSGCFKGSAATPTTISQPLGGKTRMEEFKLDIGVKDQYIPFVVPNRDYQEVPSARNICEYSNGSPIRGFYESTIKNIAYKPSKCDNYGYVGGNVGSGVMRPLWDDNSEIDKKIVDGIKAGEWDTDKPNEQGGGQQWKQTLVNIEKMQKLTNKKYYGPEGSKINTNEEYTVTVDTFTDKNGIQQLMTLKQNNNMLKTDVKNYKINESGYKWDTKFLGGGSTNHPGMALYISRWQDSSAYGGTYWLDTCNVQPAPGGKYNFYDTVPEESSGEAVVYYTKSVNINFDGEEFQGDKKTGDCGNKRLECSNAAGASCWGNDGGCTGNSTISDLKFELFESESESKKENNIEDASNHTYTIVASIFIFVILISYFTYLFFKFRKNKKI